MHRLSSGWFAMLQLPRPARHIRQTLHTQQNMLDFEFHVRKMCLQQNVTMDCHCHIQSRACRSIVLVMPHQWEARCQQTQ